MTVNTSRFSLKPIWFKLPKFCQYEPSICGKYYFFKWLGITIAWERLYEN